MDVRALGSVLCSILRLHFPSSDLIDAFGKANKAGAKRIIIFRYFSLLTILLMLWPFPVDLVANRRGQCGFSQFISVLDHAQCALHTSCECQVCHAHSKCICSACSFSTAQLVLCYLAGCFFRPNITSTIDQTVFIASHVCASSVTAFDPRKASTPFHPTPPHPHSLALASQHPSGF